MAQLVIPGVQVTVVKDVVVSQLSPSGVLGLVGLTEKGSKVGRAASWSSFVDTFGLGTAASMPEARQALENGVTELVIVPVDPDSATTAEATLPTVGRAAGIRIRARAPGSWANGLRVCVSHRTRDERIVGIDLEILRPGEKVGEGERLQNLTLRPGEPRNLWTLLSGETNRSSLVTVSLSDSTVYGQLQGPVPIDNPLLDLLWPQAVETALSSGADAPSDAYKDALDALDEESDVDLVAASLQDMTDINAVAEVYSAIISHCERNAAASKGRLGFGQVPRGANAAQSQDLAERLTSDRFALLAPHGALGAVAGRVGSLDYFQSPTFKTLSGLGGLSEALTQENQKALLQARVVPVVQERGRGIIVVKGITTDNDQVSVRRVADRAVRGVKLIGDLFIGRLNNAEGRVALREKLREFLAQMEKDGALVPSTDGRSPAFVLDVYASQADFQAGIVRVDLAVRPVRAIDYIYATLRVQA